MTVPQSVNEKYGLECEFKTTERHRKSRLFGQDPGEASKFPVSLGKKQPNAGAIELYYRSRH
jgi:hypothetical protein